MKLSALRARTRRRWNCCVALTAVLSVAAPCPAQDAEESAAGEGVELSPEQFDQFMTEQLGIDWQAGPAVAQIGGRAEINLPDGFRYLEKHDAHALLRAYDNIPDATDEGLLAPAGSTDWFVVFSFDDVGYIKDDEKDSIDKEALLEHFRESSQWGNQQRREAGMSELNLLGWAVEPFYNVDANSLEWGLTYESDGHEIVNYFTKQLGRRGVMNCNLVVDPEQIDQVLPVFRELMNGFGYVAGETYAEFRTGDKVAEYGLTALVAGGALAVAAKSGLLGKLWKVIVIGAIAAGGVLKKVFHAFAGRSESDALA